MLFTLPRGCLQTRFGLHFGLLSAPFSGPWALKSRLSLEKKACPKNLENMCCENCSKTSEMTSKTGWWKWPRALFLLPRTHLRSRWGPDPILAPVCFKNCYFSAHLWKNLASKWILNYNFWSKLLPQGAYVSGGGDDPPQASSIYIHIYIYIDYY